MKQDDFFIGWSDDTPKSYRSNGKLFFVSALAVMIVIAILYVQNQSGFIDSIYEFGEIQEASGYLVSDPVWGLRQENDKGEVITIPLVGYGKMGPQGTITKMMEDHSLSEGTMVTLRGMVFYYQGKKWMELTEMENSLVSSGENIDLKREVSTLGDKTYQGEIVDPKCFFGVMNPATKAVHRSCAIRCISGGIPPILVIRKNGIPADYRFLKSANSDHLIKNILPYIGVPVQVSGQEIQLDDWKVLLIEENRLKLSNSKTLMSEPYMAICY